ncbi:MAG: TIGR01777 family oxidoreductase [Pirellulales bacterium]|nr:TIGR01777 family oxidoreductase [Pirellulales bacterium]
MRVLMTGATGFIGLHVLKLLDRPAVLSRNATNARQRLAPFNISAIYDWDPLAEPPPVSAFEGIDAVIHLAGDPIANRRWNQEKKRAIRASRVQGTKNLVEGLRQVERRPSVLVSASAVGWYGSRGNQIQDESAPPADDFLAQVCVAWEREAREAQALGMRVVTLRIGVVLGNDGGAIQKMLLPFKLGVGGPLGNGRQWMPWIHVDDLAAMFVHAVEQPLVSGPMNGVAPNPATNKEFSKALGAALHRPAILPMPYLGLRWMIGELAQVIFASQRVVPRVAQDTGFHFHYPTIREAIEAILAADAHR